MDQSLLKKTGQLGMSLGKAHHRLVKDILWRLIVQTQQNYCVRCQQEMSRETFSIEHLTPWLDSDNPTKLFFDQNNISFSHLSCNTKARRSRPVNCGTLGGWGNGCRCNLCVLAKAKNRKKNYNPGRRAAKYERLGT